jgi:hypothetical protein
MFKTTQKYSHPNQKRQTLSANVKYLGKLALLATTSVYVLGYLGKYLTGYLNTLKNSNNDFEGMLVQENNPKISYTKIQSNFFNTGRKLLSDSNYRIANLYDNFQINDYSQNSQNNPSLAGLPDGKFVAAWTSYAQDGSYDGIYAKIFNNNGVATSQEFRVNNYTYSTQSDPCVSKLSNGGFVVSWSSSVQDGYNEGIYAQIYSPNGNIVGSEFKVNTYVFNSQYRPKVIGLSNGRFVIVWQSSTQDSSSDGVYGQIFNNDGTFIGNEFRVNTYTSNAQAQCCIASLSNNNFVVVWTSMYQDNSGGGIYAQIFDSEGAKIGREFRINQATTDNQDEPSVVSLLNDKFVVTWKTSAWNGYTWQNYGKIFSRIYSINGDPLSDEFLISSPNDSYYACPKSLSLSLENKFIISYYTDGGLIGSIRSALFDEFGNNIGKVGYNIYPINPCAFAITNLTNNNFLVSWGSPFNQYQGPPYGEILAQLFNIITYTPTLTTTATNSQSKTNSFSHTQTNTPTITFSSPSRRLSSVSPSNSASPRYSLSPKNSLSPPASSSSISPSGYVVKSESSPSPSSSPLASSVKDYTSSACMNKPLLINFIQSTKTNTKDLFNYARNIMNVWLDNAEENNDHTIINKFSKLKI